MTTKALAAALGVSAASATAMCKKLASTQLVEHQPYHGVQLTEAGERVALEVLRHHRLLDLTRELGLPWDAVHSEAERLEHHLSEELERPSTGRSASPRPNRTATPSPLPTWSWRRRTIGSGWATWSRPGGRCTPGAGWRSQLLRYLSPFGLVPDARVELEDKAPFGGPCRWQASGRRWAWSSRLASGWRWRRDPQRRAGSRRAFVVEIFVSRLHSGLVQHRNQILEGTSRRMHFRRELIDIALAMNGAFLINAPTRARCCTACWCRACT